MRTPFGISLQGLRDEPVRLASLGYNVPLHRTLAFGFAAFVASLAGVLFVWWDGQISPQNLGLGATIDLLIIAVIGGLGRIEGAWLGAFAFIVINNYVRDIQFPFADREGRPAVGRRKLQHGDRRHLPADRPRLARRAHGYLGPALGCCDAVGRSASRAVRSADEPGAGA